MNPRAPKQLRQLPVADQGCIAQGADTRPSVSLRAPNTP